MGQTYVAVDLGASSGRVTAVHFDGADVALDVVARFPNHAIEAEDGSLRWDLPNLLEQVEDGVAKAVATSQEPVSVAVSGWGVDYGLVDESGASQSLPYSYRDDRTRDVPSRVFERIDEFEWYRETGVATMPINTLFQLAWAVEHEPEALGRAHHLLLMPDLVNSALSGEAVTERTIASTTQMLGLEGVWRRAELAELGIPDRILGDPCPSGTVVSGPDSPIGRAVDHGLSVVAAASHDTASAFVGSGAGPGEAVLSSGTWALLGVLGEAHTSEAAFEAGLTNECGADGRTRTLHNLTGLWIVQECLKTWRETSTAVGFDTLVVEATEARPFVAIIDTNAPEFAAPGAMPSKIEAYCRRSGQAVPATRGELTRVVLEGLALQFRRSLRTLERITGEAIHGIRVVGGGAHHDLLNRLTASATGVPVTRGRPEATTVGNALAQMVAMGAIDDFAEAERLAGVEGETFLPTPHHDWTAAEQRLEAVAA